MGFVRKNAGPSTTAGTRRNGSPAVPSDVDNDVKATYVARVRPAHVKERPDSRSSTQSSLARSRVSSADSNAGDKGVVQAASKPDKAGKTAVFSTHVARIDLSFLKWFKTPIQVRWLYPKIADCHPRVAFEKELVEWFLYTVRGVRYVDIGGNYLRHAQNDRDVWSLAPLVDLVDQEREVKRQRLAVQRKLIVQRCMCLAKDAGTCTHAPVRGLAPSALLNHTVYYMTNDDLVALSSRFDTIYVSYHEYTRGEPVNVYDGELTGIVSSDGVVRVRAKGNAHGYEHSDRLPAGWSVVPVKFWPLDWATKLGVLTRSAPVPSAVTASVAAPKKLLRVEMSYNLDAVAFQASVALTPFVSLQAYIALLFLFLCIGGWYELISREAFICALAVAEIALFALLLVLRIFRRVDAGYDLCCSLLRPGWLRDSVIELTYRGNTIHIPSDVFTLYLSISRDRFLKDPHEFAKTAMQNTQHLEPSRRNAIRYVLQDVGPMFHVAEVRHVPGVFGLGLTSALGATSSPKI